ncbi:Acetolactate synthase isozyme 3 large subunit, partial [Haemophilus influenzae]
GKQKNVWNLTALQA